MEPMNRFLTAQRQSFKDFLDDVCAIPAERTKAPLPPPYATPLTIRSSFAAKASRSVLGLGFWSLFFFLLRLLTQSAHSSQDLLLPPVLKERASPNLLFFFSAPSLEEATIKHAVPTWIPDTTSIALAIRLSIKQGSPYTNLRTLYAGLGQPAGITTFPLHLNDVTINIADNDVHVHTRRGER